MNDIRGIMIEVKRRRWAKARKACNVAALFAAVACSGCALMDPNGGRLTASLGVEAIQEHTETYKVVDKRPCGGLKAWVTGCATPEENHGS